MKTETKHMFDNRQLLALLIPLIAEQLLNSLMGTADSMMVSNVGPEALSAVSLVDSINILVIQAFAALAAGGTIVCSHYVGMKRLEDARASAKQLLLVVMALSLGIMIFCLCALRPLLRLIFGSVDQGVMDAATVYFFWTALSFPAISLYNAGSAVFRAQENTRIPLAVATVSNALNIAGNAVLIWGLGMGVAGAAIATLASRVFSMVVILAVLRDRRRKLYVTGYRAIRPDGYKIRRILAMGIPNGIENSMFQFGKLVIQSTVSMMGTAAIAAHAMAAILENLNGVAGVACGIGLMTIVGECLGAGRKDEAVYYVKKIVVWGYGFLGISVALIWLAAGPITRLAGMTPESAAICRNLVDWISVFKPIFWVPAFIIPYGMRAAGDVRFSMITSTIIMWTARVTVAIYLARALGFGPIAVWIGMFIDWMIRSVVYSLRFYSRRWLRFSVL
ncbi:MATE family efflux transporter [Clostridium vitabionis]|uniref:MATE family efflux transporter n=1 Tax=Clostridium vitabionis TaxID=2784388 RepID=UPI00188AC770|nr:MATE family efflux transporter [Clostridium vitabionis]